MRQLKQPSFMEYGDPKPLEKQASSSQDIISSLIQICRNSTRKYVDLEFAPNSKHLIQEKSSIHTYDWSSFIWARPDKFFKDFKLFNVSGNIRHSFAKRHVPQKDISKSDILQGALGNCYFLAAVCSMAEISDHLIKRLFLCSEVNPFGVYGTQIFFNGDWKTVIIDDFFPCYPDERGPCFTKGNNDEIWVMLLEKAWAKLHGNYEKVEAGIASESLRSLTGAPVEVFFKDDPNIDLWSILKNSFKNKFPMTAGVDEEENLSGSKIGKKNLVPSHVYSLLSVTEIYHPSRGEQRLLKLRNPWGNKEWKGDWSDESTIWTEELAKKLSHDRNSDDGTFFIEFRDFKESFSEIAVCYYHDEFKNTSLTFKPSRKASYFNIKIEKAGEYYFSIIQLSRKLMQEEYEHKYSICKILIAKVENNGQLKFIAAKQKADQSMFVHLDSLEVGSYVVYVKTFNQGSNGQQNYIAVGSKENDITLNIYGVDRTIIKSAIKIKSFVEKTYLTRAISSKKKQNYKEIGRPDVEKAFDFYEDEGFGYFYIANNGNKKFLSKINLQKSEGLKFKGGRTLLDFELSGNIDKIYVCTVEYFGYSLKYAESLTY